MMRRPVAGIFSGKPIGESVQASRIFADRVLAILDVVALVVGAATTIALFIFYLWQSRQARYFTSYSLLEEAAYTFIGAHNYLRFGYLNSGFLQDFSTSLSPADHPYIYNHMPPGPDLFTSILLWLFGDNYASVRAFFAVSALAGFVVYFLFARMLLQRLGMRLSGVVLLLIGPWVIIQLFDRQIYSPFLLLAFLPLLLVFLFLDKQRAGYLIGAVCVIPLSAFYIEYALLSAIIVCWTMLYVTQLMPLKFRHMVIIGAAFAAGIGAHLVQNLLFLGWDNFLLELKYTLSNRITGYPTQQALQSFYHHLGVLHHGSHPITLAALKAQLRDNFSIPATAGAPLLLLSCVVWSFAGHGVYFSTETGKPVFDWSAVKAQLVLFARLIAWAVFTVLAPFFLFPAFAQEVNLRGIGNHFFLAIPLAFLAGYGLWVLSYSGHRGASILVGLLKAKGSPTKSVTATGPAFTRLGTFVARIAAMIGIAIALVGTSKAVFDNARGELSYVLGQSPDKWSPVYDIRRFSGDLFMTNINVPTVGFLTAAPGFGVCGPDSVKQNGQLNLAECKTAFVRRYGYWSAQRPHYFFYFTKPALFPGFADCMPVGLLIGSTRAGNECVQDLRTRLESHYPLVMKNSVVSVFDLSKIDAKRKDQ